MWHGNWTNLHARREADVIRADVMSAGVVQYADSRLATVMLLCESADFLKDDGGAPP